MKNYKYKEPKLKENINILMKRQTNTEVKKENELILEQFYRYLFLRGDLYSIQWPEIFLKNKIFTKYFIWIYCVGVKYVKRYLFLYSNNCKQQLKMLGWVKIYL